MIHLLDCISNEDIAEEIKEIQSKNKLACNTQKSNHAARMKK
jgi:hypothetical protein